MRQFLSVGFVVLVIGCSSTPPATQDAGPPPVVCTDAEVKCGDECAVLAQADKHCGACGNACPDGQACAGSACYPKACGAMTCAGTQVCVDDVCLDRACFGLTCPEGQACAGGACHPKSCEGTTCDPSQVCFNQACAEAACVGVVCPAGLACVRGTCVTDTCSDGVKDGAETDGDCGGVCAGCADGKACVKTSDCSSRVCAAGKCVAPSCADGVRNGDEAAIDCGGSCAKCPVSSVCRVSSDCASGVCEAGRCAEATCTDGAKNGGETDVDCGGGACPACGDGKACAVVSDCVSSRCDAQKCVSASCQNAMKDTGETDVDCGGVCAPCANSRSCGANSDCLSGVCDGTKHCAPPTCMDTTKNGLETDVDCGGTCLACAPGKACLAPADCTSRVCVSNVCRAPTCTDGVVNGGESDVDCGGSGSCNRCLEGQACVSGADCLSNGCVAAKCTQVPLLGTPIQLTSSGAPRDVAAGDVDGDGKPDVVVTTPSGYDLTVNYGNGLGGFTATSPLAVGGSGCGPGTVALADVNLDGKQDILTGRCMAGPGGYGGCRVTLFTNLGSRTFLAGADFERYHGAWSGCGAGIAVGNFNGDPYIDVVVGDEETTNYVSDPDSRAAYAWLGQADGGFGGATELPLAGPWVASADFDRDGRADVVGHSMTRGNASVFLGTAMGINTTTSQAFGVGAGKGAVVTALVNADASPDIVSAAQSANRVNVAMGLGNGTFIAPATYTVPSPYGVAVADITGDGQVDLVVGTSQGVAVLPGKPDGTFDPPAFYQATALGGAVGRLAIGDFNLDGKPDVAAVANNKAWVLLNVRQ